MTTDNMAILTALQLELGSRVMSDMAGENGPVREGVIRKRAFMAGPPLKQAINVYKGKHKSVEKFTVGGRVWHQALGSYWTVERWSKKGNLVCRRMYGEGQGVVKVFAPRDVKSAAVTDLRLVN